MTNLQQYALDHNIDEKEMSELTGVGINGIRSICRRGIKSQPTALRYAKAIGCKASEILEEEFNLNRFKADIIAHLNDGEYEAIRELCS